MRIVVTGSRTWLNEAQIKKEILEWIMDSDHQITIIVGYDPKKDKPGGVDKMAYKWAKSLGARVIPEPADWKNGRFVSFGNRHVNMAGFDRNELMLDKHEPDLVLAFRAAGKSNGTDHCIKEARKRNIPVKVIHEQT